MSNLDASRIAVRYMTAVIKVLKTRFPNLTTGETAELAEKLIEAVLLSTDKKELE